MFIRPVSVSLGAAVALGLALTIPASAGATTPSAPRVTPRPAPTASMFTGLGMIPASVARALGLQRVSSPLVSSTAVAAQTGGGQSSGLPPAVAAGANPIGGVEYPATHTLYVLNLYDSTVSVINTKNCNATDLSGVGRSPGPSRSAATRWGSRWMM